jgi:elongation factor P
MDTSDFKNGLSISLDNDIFIIVEFQHVKPGKGPAFVRTKLRNVRSGAVIEKTFRAGEKMDQAILERFPLQFSYEQDGEYFFMDTDSYELVEVPRAKIGDAVKYLKDGVEVNALSHKGEVINVELPMTLEFEVTHTEPGFKGDTATGGNKPATLETGAQVQVPLFINIGDRIKVDTRTGAYLERCKD